MRLLRVKLMNEDIHLAGFRMGPVMRSNRWRVDQTFKQPAAAA